MLNVFRRGQMYFIGSFLVAIPLGALLLKLPWVVYRPEGVVTPIGWVDALFSATSAICVTGFSTLAIGDLNWIGQCLLIAMVQLGGLGIITLSASIMIFLGRTMSVDDTMMIANLNENFSLRHTESLVKTVLIFVFAIEAVGALALWLSFWLSGVENWYNSIYMAIFHAIGSFCNAGFSPYPDSLCGMPVSIKVVTAALVATGGLGWYVYYDLSHGKDKSRMLMLHTRIVLWMTAILIVAGALGIWLFEWAADNPIGTVDAFFQSITTRSGGFNTVPIVDQVGADGTVTAKGLSTNSLTLMIVLMLIGAAPGSTAGGIKVVAVALAVMAIINTFKGNQRVIFFKREIPMSYILKSFTIICTFLILSTAGAVLLSTESAAAQHTYFESVSAVSTVGLSAGLTAGATAANKLAMVILMFVGRLGPFTLMLFLLGREKTSRLRHPEERVIIG